MGIEYKRFSINFEGIVVSLPHHGEIKQDILKSIDNIKKTYPSTFIQNVPGLITDFWLDNDTKDVSYYSLFFDKSKEIITNVFSEIFRMNITGFKFEVDKFWFQQYFDLGTHKLHAHYKCDYVMVYYVDLPEKDPTVFYNQFYDTYQTIDAKEGDLVFFPSKVFHTSIPSKCKTIISSNVQIEETH